jgi:hypothetical protein
MVIGPAVASTILTFSDPKNYGVFDFHVWQEVFNEKLKGYTVKNYIKLLYKLREIANKYDVEVRTVEKAFLQIITPNIRNVGKAIAELHFQLFKYRSISFSASINRRSAPST